MALGLGCITIAVAGLAQKLVAVSARLSTFAEESMPEHAMIGKVGCAAMLLTTCMSPLSRCTSAALSLSKMKSEPQSLRAGRHPRSKAFLRSVSPMGFCVLHVACCMLRAVPLHATD